MFPGESGTNKNFNFMTEKPKNVEEAILAYSSMLPNLYAESAMDFKRLYTVAYVAHETGEEITLTALMDALTANEHFTASEEDIRIIAGKRLKEIMHVKDILYILRDVIK